MPMNVYQRTVIAAVITACLPFASSAAPIARVDFAAGSVSAIAPDGRSRALTKGSEVEVGETVATGQGRAQLRFVDGAYMSLQPQTEFKIEEFKLSGKDEPGDNIVMNLIKGGMRTITGLIGRTNRSGYRLKTDVATIGIRGTEYSVRYTNSIEVFVTDGAISVENQSGSFTVPAGTGVLVSNDQTPPQQTDHKPVLPPETPVEREVGQSVDRVPPPLNPVQEASSSITQALLTGKLSVHAAFSGYDTCGDWCFDVVNMLNSTAELDASGRLIAFADPSPLAPAGVTTVGTASIADTGNDGVIAWGRWTGGVMAGDGNLGGNSFTADLTSSGISLHYLVGTPTPVTDISALQAANTTATYSLLGGSSPTMQSGEVGSLTGGQLTANFGSMTVDVSLSLSIAQRNYGITATGLPISGAGFSGAASASGCQFQCFADVAGFFAGANAVRAGAAYKINDSGDVFGVAAFTKN